MRSNIIRWIYFFLNKKINCETVLNESIEKATKRRKKEQKKLGIKMNSIKLEFISREKNTHKVTRNQK